jgi:hypothetical protein
LVKALKVAVLEWVHELDALEVLEEEVLVVWADYKGPGDSRRYPSYRRLLQ